MEKNLKDPRIKGKYYHLNEKIQDTQILQKTDLVRIIWLSRQSRKSKSLYRMLNKALMDQMDMSRSINIKKVQ